MSATTQYTDFSDLYTGLQNATREQTGVTATENQAKRYINIALHDMHVGRAEIFPWAERSAVLLTQPKYTTGTVTTVKGDETVEGADSPVWSTTNDFGIANVRAGGKMTFAGALDVYEVSSVTDADTLELTGKFVGTALSGATYVYFEDEYALASDFLRPIDQQQFSDSMPIDLISRTEFRRNWPRNSTPGRPKVAAIFDKSFGATTTPVRKIRFHNPPDEAFNIPYSYATSNLAVSNLGVEKTQLAADADEPIVPLRYRHAILFHALYHWYRDKKNDDRTQLAKGEYEQIIVRVADDTEMGTRHASIRPRRGSYVRKARRPWSAGSNQFDIDGKFDRFER